MLLGCWDTCRLGHTLVTSSGVVIVIFEHTLFIPCSSVSIVNFEHVITGWVSLEEFYDGNEKLSCNAEYTGLILNEQQFTGFQQLSFKIEYAYTLTFTV